MRASVIMQNRIKQNEKIIIHWNSEIKEIEGDESVNGINIINNVSNQSKNIKLSGVFIAIGHQPNTDIFKNNYLFDLIY